MPIIIIEGGELVGKTSVVRALQDMIPYHTLIKLSGYPTSTVQDMRERGAMVARQYEHFKNLIATFSNDRIRTLIFDRYSTTEKVMFPHSFQFGDMADSLRFMKHMGAKQFILTAPVDVLKARYNERRAANSLENQGFRTIIEVHERYKQEAQESPIDTVIINNDGSYSIREIAEQIINEARVPIYSIDD